jgi:hypothetical protein
MALQLHNCILEGAVPFVDAQSLEQHHEDHGMMLGLPTPAEYEKAAEDFLFGPLCDACHECHRPQGGRARFDTVSYKYGAISADGHIATFMILEGINHHYPSNWAYYLSRCK